jgi:hypothetical protein
MSIAVDFPALRETHTPVRREVREPVAFPVEPIVEEAPDAIFTAAEIQQFHADDAAAVGTIARIMTTLFTYTVIIMGVVIYWTLSVVN